MRGPKVSDQRFRFWQLGMRDWLDIFIALIALAKARRKLSRACYKLPPMTATRMEADRQPAFADPHKADWITRISRSVPRAARIVPWRSDCLVQAEAARALLSRQNIHADIRLGARKTAEKQLDAHAWLICDGRVVTGGDIAPFEPFT